MVTVFGLGFVGLTTALGFASLGYKVYGVDVDEQRKFILRNGELPFLEPEMDLVLREHLNSNFFVTDDAESAIADSQYVFYCVGTPYGDDGSADLTYLFSAIDRTIADIRDDQYRVLVTKSTIPPSTTLERIVPYISEKGSVAEKIGIANNPEFLREGHCWHDFIHSDRIVLGVDDNKTAEMLTKLYEPMQVPIKCVSWNTGEFIKYLSNTLLATLISYSNEMSQIADAIGNIDVAEAFHILHMDKRWNDAEMKSYAYPGCGYGGYCLPKDTNALFAQARAKGYTPAILGDVIQTNDQRSKYIAKKIAGDLGFDKTIGILGLSFKPNSDDVRDTPAVRIIRELINMGYSKIVAYDPVAEEVFTQKYSELNVKMMSSADEVYVSADVIAITTAWDEFKSIKHDGVKRVEDCRYCLNGGTV